MFENLSPAVTGRRYKAKVTRYRFITPTTLLFDLEAAEPVPIYRDE
jgi:hypothetical protein